MICSSWAWPNMFEVARGKIGLYDDTKSIISRVKLLMLTDPTELYNNPRYGLGLRKYMFNYNNENTIARIRDDLIEQLRMWEPAVIPEQTTVSSGLKYTPEGDLEQQSADINKLKLTVTLVTTYMRTVTFGISEEDLKVIV